MLTFKENKIEIARGLLDPLFLDTVQRLMLHAVKSYVEKPPEFFGPDPQLAKRYPLGRLLVTEAILCAVTPMVSEMVGAQVLPTYSFPVINFPGAELTKHTDRPACEVTASLTLVNQPNTVWPLYVENSTKTTHRVDLEPGDMVIYDGINFPHWREAQEPGHFNISVFFHFVLVGGPYQNWHFRELIYNDSAPNLFDPVELAPLFPSKG